MDRRTFLGTLGVTGALTLGAAHRALADDSGNGAVLMPAFFIGHGNPLNAVEDNRFTRGWKEAMKDVPPPTAILCVSAHWLTRGTYVTAMSQLRIIRNGRGAARELNRIRYAAPGNPALAAQIANTVQSTSVELDYHWGLDEAAIPVLRHVFPDANVPVLEMSIDERRPAAWHYHLGRELQYLRRQGVLVIGSGNIAHNPSAGDLSLAYDGFDWAIEADEIVKSKIRSGDHSALCAYESLGNAVSLAVPKPDHYYPLLYVVGMQTEKDKVTIFNDALAYGGVTMTSVRLGT